MKKVLGIAILVLLAAPAVAQKEDMAKSTHDQRVVREVDRKSKRGKKDVSLKKKVRIDKKDARKSKRKKQPKRPKRKN
jgi:hypothetical protein